MCAEKSKDEGVTKKQRGKSKGVKSKFVQNGFYEQDWCNFEDKYKISNLGYE